MTTEQIELRARDFVAAVALYVNLIEHTTFYSPEERRLAFLRMREALKAVLADKDLMHRAALLATAMRGAVHLVERIVS